jgi:4-aminobutyrate aminotransferase-like enzyme
VGQTGRETLTGLSDGGRRLIDETVGPRRLSQTSVMAASIDDPLAVAKADLLYLWDEYGTEHLDFAAAMAPLGHRYQPLNDLLAEHLRFYGWTAVQGQHLQRWTVALASRLSAAFTGPGEEPRRVLFCEGERHAVAEAVRSASRDGPAAVVDTGRHGWMVAEPGRGGPFLHPSDVDALGWDGFGCLLLAGVDTAHAPVPFLREWVLAARARDVPVVFDESATGFGVTGVMWAQEHSGLVADVTVLGGPVGGGLPLGAVVGPRRFVPDDRDPSRHSGHPWACAAGWVVVDTVNPAMLAHADECGREVAAALGTLCEQFPGHLSGHHGVGLLRGLRFRDPSLAARFPSLARARGLHLAPAVGGTVTIAPVLVSSVNEMKRGVDLIADALMSWDDGDGPGEQGREGQ